MKKQRIEEFEEITDEEQELVDSYMDEEIEEAKEQEKKEAKLRKANEKILKKELDDTDLEEYEIEDDFVEEKKEPKNVFKKLFNILFVVLCILILLAIIDIIAVSKFEKGPFFAIPVYTYDDGGTKEYYGLGYKVIKYHQLQGRRDLEIGSWALKYNVDPIYSEIVDLAIEFNNDEAGSYKKYYKKLLIVTGTLKKVDQDNNQITLSYDDEEGGKYNFNVVCNMETEDSINILEPKYEVSAMGTMVGYDYKTAKRTPTIYLDNCFSEQ